MPRTALSQDETATLRNIYRRDVQFWDHWGLNVKLAKKEGRAAMGTSWVMLCYRPGPDLPQLRAEMNNLYLLALQEYAGQYGLDVCVDTATNKVVLFNPTSSDPEWLKGCLRPVPEAD